MERQHIAKESALNFIKNNEKRQNIHKYIQTAKRLTKEYVLLEQEQQKFFYAKNLATKHRENIKNAAKNNKKTYLNTTYNNFQSSQSVETAVKIQDWLKKLKKWGLEGYKVIMGLRKEITNQELIYHIQDTKHEYSYVLNEEQYLKLLENNSLSMSYASLESLEKIIAEGPPDNSETDAFMADLFKLQVNATQAKVQQVLEPNFNKAELANDAVYQYLLHGDNGKPFLTKENKQKTEQENKDKEDINHARLYELYSQISAHYNKWERNEDGTFKKIKDKRTLKSFIQKYIAAKLDKDNTAFYKTGDAIQDNMTLIENKVGNAVVSISTIRRAIQGISLLEEKTDKKELEKELIEMFTYSGTEKFAKSIQMGAKNFAEKNIKELFK